jgi:hypothetical protein
LKAITLWQPWATLVALNGKRFETRSWPTTYTGPLAIHASKNAAALDAIFGAETPPAYRAMKRLLTSVGLVSAERFPLGVVVCTVELVCCWRTDYMAGHELLTEHERIVGDFSPGRFAWGLAKPTPFEPPIAASGHQGLWNWTPPAELLSGDAPQEVGLFDGP